MKYDLGVAVSDGVNLAFLHRHIQQLTGKTPLTIAYTRDAALEVDQRTAWPGC